MSCGAFIRPVLFFFLPTSDSLPPLRRRSVQGRRTSSASTAEAPSCRVCAVVLSRATEFLNRRSECRKALFLLLLQALLLQELLLLLLLLLLQKLQLLLLRHWERGG